MVTPPPPPPPFPSNVMIYVGGGGVHVVSIYVAIIPRNCSNEKFYFLKKGRSEQLSGRPPVSRAGGRAFEA